MGIICQYQKICWLYLSVVINLWLRAVIDRSLPWQMAAQLACDTQQIALWWSKRSENVIIHTDWGFVRFSGLSGIIEAAWPAGQHERKGCCYVSALAESFSTLWKWTVSTKRILPAQKVRRTVVFNSIECDYECWRRYCVCDGLGSEQVEKQNIA